MLERPKCVTLVATCATVVLLAFPRVALALPIASAGTAAEAADPEVAVDLFRKAPYLIDPGDPSRMTVLWQLAATDTARIEWGIDTTYALGTVQTLEYGYGH